MAPVSDKQVKIIAQVQTRIQAKDQFTAEKIFDCSHPNCIKIFTLQSECGELKVNEGR